MSVRLTDRQLEAVANMEKYVGAAWNRTSFSTYEEFDAYFKLLSKKADKKKAFASLPKEEKAAVRQRKKERSLAYYSLEANLSKYGAEYVAKYRPSMNRLKRKLAEKCGNSELASSVAWKLEILVDESSKAESIAESMSSSWRGASSIRAKLSSKGYSKESVSAALASVEESVPEAASKALSKILASGISDKQKILSRMASRGFRYADASRAMKDAGIR